ncbi:aminotransferase class IV [Comamonas sp. GB3 AK4-5]|uniref:aminotransferase class IV n=1 Tax=Comamonas sp. GB3 AK4-5 TaxID=3231487 RepID=UPI00351EEFB7
MVKQGVVHTPDSGVLHGISRQTVLELCVRQGLCARVAPLPVAELRAADEVFITSTAGGVMPVSRLDAQALPHFPGPITQRLHAAYWALHDEPGMRDPVDFGG